MFEQTEDGFAWWDKQRRALGEPESRYLPLDECPWPLPKKPEPYGDQAILWNEVKTFLVHHVFLPDDRLYDVLTAWVLATWIPEKWDVVPYLLVKGPLGCGKTRLLETLGAIAYRGIFSANMTSAALFRVIELHRPTIFLDETEIYMKETYSDVAHLLNAGYRRGVRAWRVERDADGTLYVKGYNVLGFKALAGTRELANTLQSRSIVVDMVKNVQRVNFAVNRKIAQALRNRLLQWRFDELSSFREDMNESEDTETIPQTLFALSQKCPDGRLLELFHCLLAVANDGTENILSYAETTYEVRESEAQATVECQVLEALLKCSQDFDGGVLTKTVTQQLNKELSEKDQFTTRYVGKVLRSLGFKPVHHNRGNGIRLDRRMIEYRARQYQLDGVVPQGRSLSFTASAELENGRGLEKTPTSSLNNDEDTASASSPAGQCWICRKPMPSDLSDCTTAEGKPCHIMCYKRLKQGRKHPLT